jgi:hypothetical protein
VSDCHNIISTVVKGNLPAQKRREVTYRSYKTFDIDQLGWITNLFKTSWTFNQL